MGEVWLSKRALGLHLAVLIIAPACLVAFWWQLHRALQGNALSWAYCFEWPIFAVLSVIAWWQLVHDSALEREARRGQREMPAPLSPITPTWRDEDESEELAAYNRWLRELSTTGRARGRRR